MTINELMSELAELYPSSFDKGNALTAWTPKYRKALGDLEGMRLQDAWDECCATFTKQSAPKPADIRACNFGVRGIGKKPHPHEDTAAIIAYKAENWERLRDEWKANHTDVVTACRHNNCEIHLDYNLKKIAETAAMREYHCQHDHTLPAILVHLEAETINQIIDKFGYGGPPRQEPAAPGMRRM